MRRIIPEVEDLDPDAVYRGLTLPGALAEPHRRSWVALGVVASVDGAATVEGRSAALGGAADRVAFRQLRASCDAILVGAGTVRDEGYRPVAGSEARRASRRARGLAEVPRLVIVSRALDLAPDLEVFSDPTHRPLVVTHGQQHGAAIAALREVAEVVTVGDAGVDLEETLRGLADRGLERVLCEGGPRLAGSLHQHDLVDEVFVTVAPTVVGGSAPRIVVGDDETPRAMELVSLHEHEGELLLRYQRRRATDSHGTGASAAARLESPTAPR